MNWDDKKNDDFDGFAKKDDKENHEHEYNDGKCFHCGLTRQQVREGWK